MVPEVDLQFIPRRNSVEPRVRVTVFRECGIAILNVRLSAISEIWAPASESREDVMRAFRESLPMLLPSFNRTISSMPSGAVTIIASIASRPVTGRLSSQTGREFVAC
jgi:hypothetical protein